MRSIRLNTDGPVFGMAGKEGDYVALLTPDEHCRVGSLTVKDLMDGYLWRLHFNTEEGYHIVLLPSGVIRLMLDSTIAFESKDVTKVAEEMEARTIPSRITVEFSRTEAEHLRLLVDSHCTEVADPRSICDKLTAALSEGVPATAN